MIILPSEPEPKVIMDIGGFIDSTLVGTRIVKTCFMDRTRLWGKVVKDITRLFKAFSRTEHTVVGLEFKLLKIIQERIRPVSRTTYA